MKTSIALLFVTFFVASWAKASAEVLTSRELQTFTGRIAALELMNAATNAKLANITNGSVFVSSSPSFNINALVNATGTRSVRFGYNSATNVRTDNSNPYSFCANSGSDILPCSRLGYGTHTVTARTYSSSSGGGTAGPIVSMTFTIVADPAPAPVQPPLVAPIVAPVSTKAPTKAPTKPPTKSPTKSPTKAPVKAPTAPVAATIAPTQPITYVPGKATVLQNGMRLSEGLTSRLIAQSGTPVRFGNGQQSSVSFHTLPDGAAIFRDSSSSSYKYVSNSEASSNAGVGSITFDQFGNVTGYERLQSGTIRNCGGGKTFWNTWLTCEEQASGHVWEIDPFTRTARRTLLASTYTAPWESAAYDNRNPDSPKFYVTADKSNGALLRFTPSTAAVATARSSGNYLNLLHTAGADVRYEYLVLTQVTTSTGTFSWTTNVATAEASAGSLYKASEGLDIRDGFLYMTCKTDRLLFILNLDAGTYTRSSTVSGAFNGQPDQVARLLDDVDQDILYFCEDVGTFAGVHGRDANGKYYTILQAESGLDGETSGLAFGPGNMLMYVSFQTVGRIYEIRRTDGRPFSGQRLDIKYHTDTNPNPFIP